MRPWIGNVLWSIALTLIASTGQANAADRPALQSGSGADRLSSLARSEVAREEVRQGATDDEGRSGDVERRSREDAERKEADVRVDDETLAFVREHQPELADLLKYLKAKRQSDYDEAMKEILRVRERLENLKKRDQELHDVELALWQNSARLRLWAASVSASGKKLDEADRKKLTELVTRENQLITKRLMLEKARAEARLEQLDQQLSKRKAQSDSLIARGIKVWESRIERPSPKGKNKTPAGESKKQPENASDP